jgi:hypothetical protein
MTVLFVNVANDAAQKRYCVHVCRIIEIINNTRGGIVILIQ